MGQGSFPSLTYFCDGTMTFGSGDFNGDGKADLWCRLPQDTQRVRGMYVAMSTGEGWTGWSGPTDATAVPYWCSGDLQVGTGDFNGDGRSDLYCHEPSGSQNTWVLLSNDQVDGFSPNAVWLTNWCQAYQHIGDFDGDGKTDVMCHIGNDTSVSTAGGIRGRTDLLTEILSPTGGTTSVTYTPSSDWENTNNPPVRETVTSVTVDDGRGWTATTSYMYAGGKIDREKGRTLGFAYSKTTPPKLVNETAAPYTETWFSQEIASAGAVTKQDRRSGAGSLLSSVENTLVVSGDGDTEPYTAKVTDRTSYVYDDSGTGCGSWPCPNGERRYQEYDYDDYGNRVEVRDYGNLDAADDERTTVQEIYPNTTDYVVNRTARTTTYYGIGTLGATLTDALVFYDGASVYNVSPSVGLRTNTSVWLNTESRYVAHCPQAACVEYDLDGNVTKTIDTHNAETLVAYDTTYNKFPISVTNALGHVAQTTQWDVLCEAPEVSLDPNQQQTTTSYDELCRHERTDGPGGVFAENVYSGLGDPNAQYTETQSPSPDGTGYFWTRTYFDGLGRSYASESESGEPGKLAVSGEVSFNARGLVATAAQPRFDTDPQYWTTFTYDSRNRLLERKLPDLNTVTHSYGLDYVLTTNPEGDLVSESRSPNGLITFLGEYWNGVPVVTTTTTDPDARTQHVYDHVNNHWVTVFDSLGRPIAISDPDSGTETREYDDSGLLTATVNALGERTELAYDLLGRLLTKTTRAGTPEAEVTTFTYDQDRVGYFNKGFLTRMDDTAGFEEMDYDVLGRPARTKRNLDAQDYVFERFYNAAGLPESVVYPDSDVVSWTYDAAGGLETETGTITASTYDAAGRLVSRGFTNDVTTDVTYSQTRGWIENVHTFKNGTTHQNLTYAYYADGMIQSVTSPKNKESWAYQYDDLNRLELAVNVDTPSLSQSFSYDEIGNVLANSDIGTYTYPNPGDPKPHAVTTAGSRSYQYNDVGQMTSRNGTVLQWNGDGKPSSIGNIGFVYDGVGNRLKKLSGGQQTRYIGGDYEIENNGTITKYLAGGKKRGNNIFIHHKDHLGSIQVVTNSAGWQVLRQKHKPFGDQHEVVGWHTESKGWIGEREEETELVYLNARYYDPEIGRFTAPDPVVRPGQNLNRYAYSLNSPISFKDPSGLDRICVTENYGSRGSRTVCYVTFDGGGGYSFPLGGVGGGSGTGGGSAFGRRGGDRGGDERPGIARERVQERLQNTDDDTALGGDDDTGGNDDTTDQTGSQSTGANNSQNGTQDDSSQAGSSTTNNSAALAAIGGAASSVTDSLTSIVDAWTGMVTLDAGQVLDAYDYGPLGQTDDAGGIYYWGTVGAVWTAAAAVTAAIAVEAAGVSTKIAIHGPHHTFGNLGKLPHVQMNWWRAGVDGSGKAFRLPLPKGWWRPKS